MERISNMIESGMRIAALSCTLTAMAGFGLGLIFGGCWVIDWAAYQAAWALAAADGNTIAPHEGLATGLKVAMWGWIACGGGIVGFIAMFLLHEKVYCPLSDVYWFVGLRRRWYGVCASTSYHCYSRETHHCGLHRGHDGGHDGEHDSLNPADPFAWE